MDLRNRFADIMSETPSISGTAEHSPVADVSVKGTNTRKRNALFTTSLIALAIVVVVMLYHKRSNIFKEQVRKRIPQFNSKTPQIDDIELQSENGVDYDQSDPLFQPFEY